MSKYTDGGTEQDLQFVSRLQDKTNLLQSPAQSNIFDINTILTWSVNMKYYEYCESRDVFLLLQHVDLLNLLPFILINV